MLAVDGNNQSALFWCCVRSQFFNIMRTAPAVPTMMYGYGDTQNHYQATVDLVEVCVNAERGICQNPMVFWPVHGLHRPPPVHE